MNKKQQASEQTKKLILDKATILFSERGYASTSIEDIVSSTGVSKGNIYYHFGNKENLFLKLLNDWHAHWQEQWENKVSSFHTCTDKLYGLAEHTVLHDFKHPLTKAMEEFWTSSFVKVEVRNQVDALMKHHLRLYEQILEEGMKNNEFKQRDLLILSMILEGLLSGIGLFAYKLSTEQALTLYKEAIHTLLEGISV
ncbi:TetR/AcrR family transcriptional regulator [Priestia koreensis]|uniref:TetR/AcrR family transcriptional regulator n=1 Tax=Priestia koreensis TaxID=284581 RepID=UPI001F5A569F|nr:TetR/AcrR family transcriptional regulator [Priestia koreensis]MCM3005258.1 TetR/AcrR family transcriptional regulator [Priestia koreensis]UNL86475.1 TetR family transcriptional regulator [Priestia koreensis]